MLYHIGTLLFFLCALELLIFVVLYAVRSRWRSTSVGRAVMGFKAAILAIMVAAIIFYFVPTETDTTLAITRIVLYGSLVLALARLIYVLLRIQRQDRYDEHSHT